MPARTPPEPPKYHGITIDDMPGKDPITRAMNFSLFRRGKLPGYRSCKGLFGEGLKTEFLRINAGQRAKSLIARERRMAEGTRVRARLALPPAEPERAQGRVNPGGTREGALRGGREGTGDGPDGPDGPDRPNRAHVA